MLFTLTLAAALAQEPDDACEPLPLTLTTSQMQALLPDPTAASLQSLILGFGAGHFYAGQYSEGAVFAATQIVGLGLAGLASFGDLSPESTRAIQGVGLTIFGASRVGDFAMAPYSARKGQLDMMLRARKE